MIRYVLLLCGALAGCASADSTVDQPLLPASGGMSGPSEQTGGVMGTGGSVVAECSPGEKVVCDCSGVDGHKTCFPSGRLSACQCPLRGDGGMAEQGSEMCDPGVYSGTFTCEYMGEAAPFPIAVTGPVGFDLEVQQRGPADNCEEFCTDLVISEGSGTLFGVAGLIVAFEASLSGGLDCKSGVFRAQATMGRFGFPTPKDPNDPMGPLTIAEPPAGTFVGSLEGEHNRQATQDISGDWTLAEMAFNGSCDGPFTVTLER